MRAFIVAWRAILSFYNELFLLIGLSLLWWVTGGIFVALAALFGWALLTQGGPWWLAPLIAIPAGPATAALAVAARRCVREIRVDRTFYFDGLRTHWRQALALNAIGMIGLALMLLNILFYAYQRTSLLLLLAFVFGYLAVFWVSIQLFVHPTLVSMERPRVLAALRLATVLALGNPLYSLLLLLITAGLTVFSAVLVVPIVLIWPALLALLGAHALYLILQRAGMVSEEGAGAEAGRRDPRRE